jgi:hypothetical protein
MSTAATARVASATSTVLRKHSRRRQRQRGAHQSGEKQFT